ncbi:hypothetical protein [uncultured Microscilla sp.]|uniref:hypothetical protein n=1 Tax=uncultured Microscilla sp. TaxID=432653 RepID=UPI002616C56B|nr:hypothetical protein [uncultured Microscilla sp.]
MKDIGGNEHIDYFDQDTILDYIDGRLSDEDRALFEQQMQQDETLQLTVEGIKGFYADEQKDRPYLENLMNESEEALRGTLANAEAKTVALAARRRNVIGISVAACVALFMVLSVPRLLDNTKDKSSNEAIGATSGKDMTPKVEQKPTIKTERTTTAKKSAENAAETSNKDLDLKGNTDLLTNQVIALSKKKTQGEGNSPEKIKTDGYAVTDEDIENKEMMTPPPPPTIGLVPRKAKDDKSRETVKTTAVSKESVKKEEDKQYNKMAKKNDLPSFNAVRSAKKRRKQPKGVARKKRTQNAYMKNRSVTANDFNDQEIAIKYRTPGKLHLWVFADDANLNYYTLMKVGRDVATQTGMQLTSKKKNTKAFVSQQWGSLISSQQLNNNDVVWVYYLGKNSGQLNAAVNRLNNALIHSSAALKLVMVDNGSQQINYANHARLDEINKNAGQSPVQIQGIKAIEKPTPDNAYQKLFLGTSGDITILSNKPGNKAYQGLFTQNLLQALQSVKGDQRKGIDWKAVLKQVDRQTRKQSKALGKTQKIQKRKMRIKKSY